MVLIIARSERCAAIQFNIVRSAHAYGSLSRYCIGQRIILLCFPGMAVQNEADVSGLIGGHQKTENHSLSAKGLE